MKMANRFWLSCLLVIMLLFTACSSGVSSNAVNKEGSETGESNDEQTNNESTQEASTNTSEESVVTIDGETLTREDLAFYTLMDKVKIELNRAEDKENLTGDNLNDKMVYWDEQLAQYDNINIGLQSMIEIIAMSLLAEEKNYFVPDEKLTTKVEEFEQQIEGNKAVEQLIQDYGEKDYQHHLREYIRQSTLRDRVAHELGDEIAEENPDATDIERNFLLNEKFEELFIDQLASLEVEIQLK